MSFNLLPDTQSIRDIVEAEVKGLDGTVTDCFDDRSHLFLRAVLPRARAVRPRDKVQGGIAVMVTDQEILVCPYTFREVCRNGAITAQAIQTRHIKRLGSNATTSQVVGARADLRSAVQACCSPEVFCTNVERMRSVMEMRADRALPLLSGLSRLPCARAAQLAATILERLRAGGDESVFGLANAITSVARDEPDPEVKWRLEELGGAVLAKLRSPIAPRPLSSRLMAPSSDLATCVGPVSNRY